MQVLAFAVQQIPSGGATMMRMPSGLCVFFFFKCTESDVLLCVDVTCMPIGGSIVYIDHRMCSATLLT